MKVFARIGAKTIIQRNDGKILILRRSAKTSRPGGWDFAGGACDLGENPADTVIRETREETGLTITHPQILMTHASMNVDNDYVVLIGYVVKEYSGKVVLSWEHDLFEWVSVENALTRDWPEFHRQLLEKFCGK